MISVHGAAALAGFQIIQRHHDVASVIPGAASTSVRFRAPTIHEIAAQLAWDAYLRTFLAFSVRRVTSCAAAGTTRSIFVETDRKRYVASNRTNPDSLTIRKALQPYVPAINKGIARPSGDVVQTEAAAICWYATWRVDPASLLAFRGRSTSL